LAARAEWAREHVTVEERGGLVAQAAGLLSAALPWSSAR
jgi:hypothetical protein